MKKEGGKKDSKKILIIGGIALVVIGIGVFLFFMFFSPISEEDILRDPAAAMAFCGKSPEGKQTECYSQVAQVLAVENPDVALEACLAINTGNNDGDMKNCVEELAGKQTEQLKAVEICNSLKEDKNFREHCYGAMTINFDTLNSDSKLAMCDSKTGTDQENCYRSLSETFYLSDVSKSVEICNKIPDKVSKDSCLNSIIGNPEIVQANPSLSASICDALTLKSNCYSYVAPTVSAVNPQEGALICQRLSDENQKLNCYHAAWFDFKSAVLQNYDFTVSLCNSLTTKKDECLRGASEIFMTTNKAQAEAICRLASSSTAEGCLHVVQAG